MSASDKLVIRILLLVARIVASDEVAVEIKHLANHIEIYSKPEEPA